MRKLLALILLAVTLLPIANILYSIANLHQSVFDAASGGSSQELGTIQLIMVALLIVAYLILLLKSEGVPNDKKMLWAIALIVFNVLAMVVFWFHYIWKQPEYRSAPFQTQ